MTSLNRSRSRRMSNSAALTGMSLGALRLAGSLRPAGSATGGLLGLLSL